MLKHRPRKSLLFAGLLVTSSVFAGVCAVTEFYHPLTNGDGTRYPLEISIAIWEVLGPIVPVPATDGRTHLAYVIQLTNKSGSPMGIDSFNVVDPDNGNQPTGTNEVVTISNTNVTGEVQPFIDRDPLLDSDYTTMLGAGQAGSMYFDVTYPGPRSVPAHISHQVTVTSLAENLPPSSAIYTAVDEPINVNRGGPVVLSPPLKGKGWLDANGCCVTITPHRGGVEPVNGKARAPEMFAIDFIQLDANGRAFEGPVDQVGSYAYYGSDVYSAAAGKVVEVVRDLPNATPGQNPATTTAQTASGNHVIEDIGGRYVLYAHMIPGSVTVAVGDSVPVGYVLGKLGDSGNSSAPHLHFQVMDRPSALGAHGLPFVFDSMNREATVTGTVSDELNNIGDGTPVQLNRATAKQFEKTLPLTLDVLDF